MEILSNLIRTSYRLQFHHKRVLLPRQEDSLLTPIIGRVLQHHIKFPDHTRDDETKFHISEVAAQASTWAEAEGLDRGFVIRGKCCCLVGELYRQLARLKPSLRDKFAGAVEIAAVLTCRPLVYTNGNLQEQEPSTVVSILAIEFEDCYGFL